MPPVKTKVTLNYHIVKQYETKRCSTCSHKMEAHLAGIRKPELRCKPIGINFSRKYRIADNGCCDQHCPLVTRTRTR